MSLYINISYTFVDRPLIILGCEGALDNKGLEQPSSGVKQIPLARSSGRLSMYGGDRYLWFLSMELAPSHPPGAQNFEVVPTGKSVHSLV